VEQQVAQLAGREDLQAEQSLQGLQVIWRQQPKVDGIIISVNALPSHPMAATQLTSRTRQSHPPLRLREAFLRTTPFARGQIAS